MLAFKERKNAQTRSKAFFGVVVFRFESSRTESMYPCDDKLSYVLYKWWLVVSFAFPSKWKKERSISHRFPSHTIGIAFEAHSLSTIRRARGKVCHCTARWFESICFYQFCFVLFLFSVISKVLSEVKQSRILVQKEDFSDILPGWQHCLSLP